MLNKDAITRTLAANHDMTLKKSREIYDDVLDILGGALSEGSQVRLAGFGSLKTVDVAPRTVRNPRTGEPINVPAKKRVKFTAASALKRDVNA